MSNSEIRAFRARDVRTSTECRIVTPFSKYKVDALKKDLKELGIQLSDGSKVKRKAELVDLYEKAPEIKQAKREDTEDYNKLLKENYRRRLVNCQAKRP